MGLFVRAQKIGPLPPVANPYPSRFQAFRRKVSRYGALGIVLILLSTLFFPQTREEFRQSSLESVAAFVMLMQAPVEFVRDIVHDAKSISTLKQEVSELEQVVRELKQESIKYNQIQFENEILRRYLNVPHKEHVTFRTAPVLATPKGGLFHSVLVGLGTKDGVQKGQGVINELGVIGRLKVVGHATSRIRLLTDPGSRIPVYLPRLKARAILAGSGSDNPTLVYIPEVDDLKEGDEVLTSGLGGVFPRGILVGHIDKISGGLISVKCAADLSQSFYLQILTVHEVNPALAGDVNGK